MAQNVELPRCLATLPAEDVVTLSPRTMWQVPWELLLFGPFANCVLLDGEHVRLVTPTALVRSAVVRSSSPDEPLHPEDYSQLLVFAPATTLINAAKLVIETGWEIALVDDAERRLITPRVVFRALLAIAQADRAATEPVTSADRARSPGASTDYLRWSDPSGSSTDCSAHFT